MHRTTSKRQPRLGELLGIFCLSFIASFIALAPIGVGLAVAFGDVSVMRTIALDFAMAWAVAVAISAGAIVRGVD